MRSVNFFWEDVKPALMQRKKLKIFLNELFKKEKRILQSINYIFCSDRYLLEINKRFLNHNFYTDTITFNYSEDKEVIIGEVYISSDRVKENAKALSLTNNEELHRVIFHGALHLCGYQDKSPNNKKEMVKAENYYLSAYFK